MPLVQLTARDLTQGKRGICGHAEVSRAFGQSDHGDPDIGGRFPWPRFLQLLTEEELDMDAKQVYDAVWNRDAIPGPDKDPKNPTWKAASVLTDTNKRLRALETKVADQNAKLTQILALLQKPRA